MKSLEDAVKEVKQLKADLSAQIKIGEHYVEVEGEWVGGSRGGNNPGYYESEPFSGYVDDYGPDTKKREAAKNKLKNIHNNSEWLSIRYDAGKALGISEEQLFSNGFSLPLSKITENLNSLRINSTDPDFEKRKNALADLVNLYKIASYEKTIIHTKNILDANYHANTSKEIRRLAGQALGYSKLRMLIGY